MKQQHALTRYILDMERGIERALKISDSQLLEASRELKGMPTTPLRAYAITEIDKRAMGS